MAVLGSSLEQTDDVVRRHARMQLLVAELRERSGLVARGGGERSLDGLEGGRPFLDDVGNQVTVGATLSPAHRTDLEFGVLNGVFVFLLVAHRVAGQLDGVEAPLLHRGQLRL